MKTLFFISICLFFISAEIRAQEKKDTLNFHDFPTKDNKLISFELTCTIQNRESIDTLSKEILFLLLNNEQIVNTPNILITELNQKIHSLKVDNLIFKPVKL